MAIENRKSGQKKKKKRELDGQMRYGKALLFGLRPRSQRGKGSINCKIFGEQPQYKVRL